MALKAGIVGLPNVGKSTLFNAITKQDILSANYPFATIEPNKGTVLVPDGRIPVLKEIYNSKKMIPTSYEFIDIAGLVKDASKGEGLGNKFLSHIRDVDAICEVIRCFDDLNVIHVENKVSPDEDADIIETELMLADLEIVIRRLSSLSKKVSSKAATLDEIDEYMALEKAELALKAGKSLREVEFTIKELQAIKQFSFLTLKPLIFLANIKEEDLGKEDNEHVLKLKEYAKEKNIKVVVMCAKLEEDLKDLSEEEAKEMLDSVGYTESGLDNIIKTTYDLLGLETFFTAGPEEIHAWTYKKGSTAYECAGKIHSDIQRGFIRAEVMSFEDLVEYRSAKNVKEHGKLRVEGKDYIVEDGDICYFRFNV